MTGPDMTARQQAVEWAVRSHDTAFDDWDGLARWLAVDPIHAILYDQVTIAADDAARTFDPSETAVPARQPARSRWMPFALAASFAAIMFGGGWVVHIAREPDFYTVSTQAGEQRSIRLDDRTSAILNGDTQLTLDRRNPRFARLDRGEAFFTVGHDPLHPFEVVSGNIVIVDLGTVFDVEQAVDLTHISVASGRVRVSTGGGSINLDAGQNVGIGTSADTAFRGAQSSDDVGAWRTGRIDFNDVTIRQLALRMHRATGARIETASNIADLRVSGSIKIGGNADTTFRSLASLLDIAIARRGDVWIWSGRRGANPS